MDIDSKRGIGAIIRQARTDEKQTQQKLADECSISRTYLADIEAGRYSPSVEVLTKLFENLDLDLNLIKNVVNTDR
ncbi:helix-turn-helix transcriptional regulator [Clostridium botulinum]|nr:helix-turn-helix transcriptional regulator [Clostridium botulinum]